MKKNLGLQVINRPNEHNHFFPIKCHKRNFQDQSTKLGEMCWLHSNKMYFPNITTGIEYFLVKFLISINGLNLRFQRWKLNIQMKSMAAVEVIEWRKIDVVLRSFIRLWIIYRIKQQPKRSTHSNGVAIKEIELCFSNTELISSACSNRTPESWQIHQYVSNERAPKRSHNSNSLIVLNRVEKNS